MNGIAATLAAGLVMLGLPATGLADCSSRSFELAAGPLVQRSVWQEFDASGRRLVREAGTLNGAIISAGLRCGQWDYLLALSQVDGRRGYDGQTSSGAPATTESTARHVGVQMQAGFGLTDTWRLSARVDTSAISRDIASTAAASGYPERFDWTLLLLGLAWQTQAGPGRLVLQAATGGQMQSRMRVTLPGRDPARLPLGRIWQTELSIGWQMPIHHDLSLHADVVHRRADIAEGNEVVITRSGSPVGVAHQPHSVAGDTALAMRLAWQF